MLALEGIRKRFGNRLVLDDLSVEVPPGQVFGLLGPNGSGKTTAMRIVFGVIDADAGTVRFEGRELDGPGRRRFGYMPEERGLYPRMTVSDQLVYLARLAGVGRAEARGRVRALLGELGVEDRADDRVDQLSLGNQQRVQLAAALVGDPEVLVLDEPFSSLDPVAVDALSATLRRRAAAGGTVLFSSHQLDLVESLCESVAVVNWGRLVLSGRVDDLKRATGRRTLRLEMDGTDGAWARRLPGVQVTNGTGPDVRLLLAPEVEPLELLDRARAAGPVHGFALETPRLGELFLDAVGRERREDGP